MLISSCSYIVDDILAVESERSDEAVEQ